MIDYVKCKKIWLSVILALLITLLTVLPAFAAESDIASTSAYSPTITIDSNNYASMKIDNVGKARYMEWIDSNGNFLHDGQMYFFNTGYDVNKTLDYENDDSFPKHDPGIAFCLQNTYKFPDRGNHTNLYETYAKEVKGTTSNNIYLIRTLYYGWNGPKSVYTDKYYQSGYLVTRSLASYYYHKGTNKNDFNDDENNPTLVSKVKGSSADPIKFSVTGLSGNTISSKFKTANKSDGTTYQYTGTMTVSCLDTDSYISVKVPTGLSLVLTKNSTTKTYAAGKTVKMYGGDKFYFTASGTNTGKFTFTATIYSCRLFVLKSKSTYADYQDLGQLRYCSTTTNFNLAAPDLTSVALQKASSNTAITNNNSCYSVAGAVYNVYTDKACTKQLKMGSTAVYIKIGANGKGTSNAKVPSGATYYCKESTAPTSNSYKLNTTGVTSVSASNSYSGKATETPVTATADVILKKINSRTGQADQSLANAEFTLKFYGAKYTSLSQLSSVTPMRTWVVKTDSNGQASLDSLIDGSDALFTLSNKTVIPLGTLTVEETKAPDGYYINTEVKLINITANANKTASVSDIPTFSEDELPATIKIAKTSDDGIKEGFTFIITDPDGNEVATVVTGANGEISVDNIKPYVTYTVTEKALPGYAQQQPQTVTPKRGETVTVSFENVAVGDLEIRKTAENGNKKANIGEIYFDILADNIYYGTYCTDDFGYATVENLRLYSNGKLIEYTVVEKGVKNDDGTYSIPYKYVQDVPPVTRTLEKGKVTEVEFYNKLLYGNVFVYKKDAAQKLPIKGAVFRLYDEDGKLLTFKAIDGKNKLTDESGVTEVATDENGKIEYVDLPYGKYYIEECITKSGLNLLADKTEIKLKEPTVDITILNTDKPEMPVAGSSNKIIIFAIGISLIILGVVSVLYSKKQRGEQ